MVNKCAVVGCSTGYARKKKKISDSSAGEVNSDSADSSTSCSVSSFHFPNEESLRNKWIKFVSREKWTPSDNTVICMLHFEEKFIKRGKTRNKLIWELNPTPTLYPPGFAPTTSTLPSTSDGPARKEPKIRNIFPDELSMFNDVDKITSLDSLNESNAPTGFSFKKLVESVVYYRLEIDDNVSPVVNEAIYVDSSLHVKLFYKNASIPLPEWFRYGTSCQLTSLSTLHNFPNYIKNRAKDMSNSLLNEMKSLEFYKTHGRPPFSSEMIRFALMQRYTSKHSYELLLNELPLPSISLLRKLTQGGIDPIKSLKVLLEAEKVDSQCILMVDEMYLQKSVQYHGGTFVGADEDGEMFKGIMCFLIVGLRKNIPYVIKSIPESKISGEWLKNEIEESISTLSNAGFTVRAVVSDNHAVNVNAFNALKKEYSPEKCTDDLFINYPGEANKVYLFFDSVHLIKNVRNNLLSAKRFIFPPFQYEGQRFSINMDGGEIKWASFHSILEKDSKLDSNLRKAPHITHQTLHPGNKKQNVQLALNIFSEDTTAALASYFPDEANSAKFLKLFHTWFIMSNSKQQINTRNFLGNAAVPGDEKPQFFRAIADWLSEWQKSQLPNCQKFTLTKQTCSALITTLRASAALIEDLLNDNFSFVFTSRFQSDPIERRFSRYRQMSGGRFLVSLREVINSEKILSIQSLLRENIDIKVSDVFTNNNQDDCIKKLLDEVRTYENDLYESFLSDDTEEVVVYIGGYLIRKISNSVSCDECKLKMIAQKDEDIPDRYLNLLSRGGLISPSHVFTSFVSHNFAMLEMVEKDVQKSIPSNIRLGACKVLGEFGSALQFSCDLHHVKNVEMVNRTVVNIYYNNKQKLMNSENRKDEVVGFKSLKLKKL